MNFPKRHTGGTQHVLETLLVQLSSNFWGINQCTFAGNAHTALTKMNRLQSIQKKYEIYHLFVCF